MGQECAKDTGALTEPVPCQLLPREAGLWQDPTLRFMGLDTGLNRVEGKSFVSHHSLRVHLTRELLRAGASDPCR